MHNSSGILKLLHEDNFIEDRKHIKYHILAYYKELYVVEDRSFISLNHKSGLISKCIPNLVSK